MPARDKDTSLKRPFGGERKRTAPVFTAGRALFCALKLGSLKGMGF